MNQHDVEDLHQITASHWNGPVGVHASANGLRRWEVTGEYGLVEAVLRAAIRDYQDFAVLRTRRGERSFREIERWFLVDDRNWHFSFVNVCEILDLEPTYIRVGLKMWREHIARYPDSATPMRCVNRIPLASQNGASPGPSKGE
jgi:hypothetical protein